MEEQKEKKWAERAMVLRMRDLERYVANQSPYPLSERELDVKALQSLREKYEAGRQGAVKALGAPFAQLKSEIIDKENALLGCFAGLAAKRLESRREMDSVQHSLSGLYAKYARSIAWTSEDDILDSLARTKFDIALDKEIAKEAASIVAAAMRASGVDRFVTVMPSRVPTETHSLLSGIYHEMSLFDVRSPTRWDTFHQHHVRRLKALPPVDDSDGKSEVLKVATRLGRAALLEKLTRELAEGMPLDE